MKLTLGNFQVALDLSRPRIDGCWGCNDDDVKKKKKAPKRKKAKNKRGVIMFPNKEIGPLATDLIEGYIDVPTSTVSASGDFYMSCKDGFAKVWLSRPWMIRPLYLLLPCASRGLLLLRPILDGDACAMLRLQSIGKKYPAAKAPVTKMCKAATRFGIPDKLVTGRLYVKVQL